MTLSLLNIVSTIGDSLLHSCNGQSFTIAL
jgi:hypothetical protein